MNQAEEREKSMQQANETGIYRTLLVGIVFGIIGVYARFAFDALWLSIASWVILAIGTVIACKAVFRMMNLK